MPILRLVYASRPIGFTPTTLLAILFTARKKNKAADVTGCMICRDDMYLELLEGPPNEVIRLFGDIQEDGRHFRATELFRRQAETRLFSDWAMRYDSLQDWMWTNNKVDRVIANKVEPADVLHVFESLAERQPETES